MTFIAVRCPHCQSEQIVKRGKTGCGTQRYLCQNPTCATGSFLLDFQQVPRSLRRNRLPTKRINGALVMRHEHPAGALVELVKIAKTSSSTNGLLHHAPKAFDRVEVMATMGG